MEIKKTPRNGMVDIMRLGFAGIVMMYHFYSNGEKHFAGGFFGVEFFMILAGFLMFSHRDSSDIASLSLPGRQSYWLDYMKKRYYRFFWCCLVAFALVFLVVQVWRDKLHGCVAICDRLSGDIWEILLVKMSGINRGGALLNSSAWTMSCMLIVEFFVMGMLTFWERPFLTFLMPLSIIAGIGYWSNLESTSSTLFHTFFTFGTLRVYLLICMGVVSYCICKKIRTLCFTRIGRWVLTVAELLGYTICVTITLYRNWRNYQFCFMLVVIAVLAISFSGKSFAGSILPANTFTNFCAEFSLSVYLTHLAVLKAFQYIYEDINDLYRQKFVFLFCALVVALAYTYIMRGVFKMLPIMKEKLKSVMLEQS